MPNNTYTVAKGEFLNSVINKIGRQIFSSTAYQNPLKRLKKGFIDNANEIEEIYVARAIGHAYDPNGEGNLDRVKPNVKTQYHQESKDIDYTVTVSDKQVRKGFTSKEGVNKVANEIIQSLHTGAEYEEYENMLKVIRDIAVGTPETAKRTVDEITDLQTAKAFTKKVKKDIKAMADRSTTYAKYENHCKASDLVLFLNKEWAVEIDVEFLASTFNKSIAEITESTIIEIPILKNEDGTDSKIRAVLCDERAIQIYDTYYAIESARNAKGKFTNQHLSTEKIYSYSNMVNVATYSIA